MSETSVILCFEIVILIGMCCCVGILLLHVMELTRPWRTKKVVLYKINKWLKMYEKRLLHCDYINNQMVSHRGITSNEFTIRLLFEGNKDKLSYSIIIATNTFLKGWSFEENLSKIFKPADKIILVVKRSKK